MDRSADMPHQATYWPPSTIDEFGRHTFLDKAPELIACRWQNDAVLFRDTQGREIVSSAVVYPACEVKPRGYLALGDFTDTQDPTDLAQAYEIQQAYRTADLSGAEYLNKAML